MGAGRLGLTWAAFYLPVEVLIHAGVLDGYFMVILNRALIFVILAASLNFINGITGQFSLGHMGFAAVGAYVSGAATTLWVTMPAGGLARESLFLGALAAGGVGAGSLGLLIGLPCLRLRGDYLAVVTLGFGEIIRTALNATDSLGGPRGLLGIPKCSGFTIICGATFLTLAVLRNLVHSPLGRAFLAIRDDELAAACCGLDAQRHKLQGFVLGSFFAGLAGGLLAHLLQMAHPGQFGFMATAELLIMVYAGGLGSLTGSALAALILTFLTEGLRLTMDGLRNSTGWPIGAEWTMSAYAFLLICIMLFRPEGLLGNREARILSLEEDP